MWDSNSCCTPRRSGTHLPAMLPPSHCKSQLMRAGPCAWALGTWEMSHSLLHQCSLSAPAPLQGASARTADLGWELQSPSQSSPLPKERVWLRSCTKDLSDLHGLPGWLELSCSRGCSFHTQAQGCGSDKHSLIFSGNTVAGAVRCSVGKSGWTRSSWQGWCNHPQRLTFSRALQESNFPTVPVTENLTRMMTSTGYQKAKDSANRIPELTAPFLFHSVFSAHSCTWTANSKEAGQRRRQIHVIHLCFDLKALHI